jgi:hypothetical protein
MMQFRQKTRQKERNPYKNAITDKRKKQSSV